MQHTAGPSTHESAGTVIAPSAECAATIAAIIIPMAFAGWLVEAVEFYEGLAADNSKVFWQEHKAVYDDCVRAPMEQLLAELTDEFGEALPALPRRAL